MNKEEFRRTTRIQDEYIHDLYPEEDEDRFIGATNIKILGFSDDMDMYVGYPWGEIGRFRMDEDMLSERSLPHICEIYDYDLHEFELLVGKNVRVRIKCIGNGFDESKFNISWSEDRFLRPIDMDSDTIHQYPEVGTYEDMEPTRIDIGDPWMFMVKFLILLAIATLFVLLVF